MICSKCFNIFQNPYLVYNVHLGSLLVDKRISVAAGGKRFIQQHTVEDRDEPRKAVLRHERAEGAREAVIRQPKSSDVE